MLYMPWCRELSQCTLLLIKRSDLSSAMMSGEWRLLLRMLDCAIVDIKEDLPGNSNSARAWLNSDELYEFSFCFCCEYLGLEPTVVRRLIKNWLNESQSVDSKLAA